MPHRLALLIGAASTCTAHAQDCDRVWVPGGLRPGAPGTVTAMCEFDADGPGPGLPRVIVGGRLDETTWPKSTYAGYWTGSEWTLLGGGPITINPFGQVLALCEFDADGPGPGQPALVAGGNLSELQVGYHRVMAWNGVEWTQLGPLMNGATHAFTRFDADGPGPALPALVAGGWFYQIGALIAPSIASWDGAQWADIGGGLAPGIVHALAAFDRDAGGPLLPTLVAGGEGLGFYETSLFEWSGISWMPMGSGVDGPVHALAVWDHDGPGPAGPSVFAGGDFGQSAGFPVANVARWDGETWVPLGQGVDAKVLALSVFDRDRSGPEPPRLFAGGEFEFAGAGPSKHLAAWDGQTWTGWPSLFDSKVSALLSSGTIAQPLLCVGGDFIRVNQDRIASFTAWDGDWHVEYGRGFNYNVEALGRWMSPAGQDIVFAGGEFTLAGGYHARRVAQFDGHEWLPAGEGADGVVRAFAEFDCDGLGPKTSEMYAGGRFETIGGVTAKRIGRWDGQRWHALGSGLGPSEAWVEGLAVFDLDASGPSLPVLIVAGSFMTAGGAPTYNIARWDGAAWGVVSSGLSTSGPITSFDPDGAGRQLPQLCVGSGGLVRLVNGSWHPTPGGLSNIRALVEHDPDDHGPMLPSVVAGPPGGNDVLHWIDGQWEYLGGTAGEKLRGVCHALAVRDPDGPGQALQRVIAAGDLTIHLPSGQSIGGANVAVWDTVGWSSINPGFHPGPPIALLVVDADGPGPLSDELHVGGVFKAIQNTPSAYYARWVCKTPSCAPDCDGNGSLSANDFACFQNRFATQDPYADCTKDSLFTIADFACFQSKFVTGCP